MLLLPLRQIEYVYSSNKYEKYEHGDNVENIIVVFFWKCGMERSFHIYLLNKFLENIFSSYMIEKIYISFPIAILTHTLVATQIGHSVFSLNKT